MRISVCWFLVIAVLCPLASEAQQKNKRAKTIPYEEVDFEDMMRRYLHKETGSPIEGIYSVSCVITTRQKRLFSKRERIKVVERKDNYARIAILKDWPGSKRDYIEVSLSYRDAKKYPIVGEINILSEGEGMIYKHLEPNGRILSFSMLEESLELLEGEFSFMEKRKTITYKVSYLKIFPKSTELTVFKN